ncbi:exopolysaccharide biosynthesis polyprenyl glycosylphosphotransferase [Devosia sp. PTR5]|uniref:Exopolysaccharide biosynthesis polyprenyl glycosylphosphotransferase n=1 Tax=Devosia oryzisoli TaxID=2774138 RepID=A0A927FUY1_9HYPH|nr:exopolysaccharide biosynthesis polyprenyl glycosylphosphotransferase [Devosia oryzisoli]MBD8066775.1 exopolysaccharide biosynthesis polyprenyl glycosylphosphotransferase [Devosia oryzisoli]
MFQDSVSLRHTELRRRRRYKIASRTYLGYALATLEGSFAALMVAFLAAFVPEGIPWGASEAPIVSAIGVGAVVAARALGPARTLLTLSTKRLFLPEAATAFLSGIGLVWLLQLIAGAPFVAPDLQVWKWLVLAAVFVCLARGLIYGRILAMFAVGQLQIERTALVGVGEDLTQFERGARIWRSGGQVMARLSLESAEVDISDQPATQFLADCARRGCDRLVLIGVNSGTPLATAILEAARPYALDVAFAPAWRGDQQRVRLLDVLHLGPANAVRVVRKPLSDGQLALKRALDILGAILALFISAPLLLLVTLAIRLDSSGPVLYRQERRGFNGNSFHILKFRSMRVTEDGRAMRPATMGDARITRVGRFIRRTSIDELPQLLNVISGTMSLVGPRPHAISHDAELSRRFALYAARQRIKPGITGWAQVNGSRGEIASQAQVEDRTLYDLEYIENWSLALEIRILWLTVFSTKVHSNAR